MSYDTLAPHYAWLETLTFGRALQRARCAPLASWRGEDPDNVLLLGDGDGRFLEQALKRWEKSDFTWIDQSGEMLRLARKRVSSGRVYFLQADVRRALGEIDPGSFDVVVTHFFLDGFTMPVLEIIIPEIERCLAPGGVWFISEFNAQRRWRRLLLAGMYRFFNIVTGMEANKFPEYEMLLAACGRRPERLGTWRAGFVIAERWLKPKDFPSGCDRNLMS